MREAVARVPGVSVLFTTPLGMRIDEGLGGTPADLSVRDLRPRPRRARPARGPRGGSPGRACRGLADLRAEKLDRRPPAPRGGRPRGGGARRPRPRGSRAGAARGPRRGRGLGGLGGPAAVRPGRRACATTGGRASPTSARFPVDAHDGVKVPLGQLAPHRGDAGAGRHAARGGQPTHRGRGHGRGRDLAGAAAEVRRAPRRGARPPHRLLPGRGRTRGEPGPRDAGPRRRRARSPWPRSSSCSTSRSEASPRRS